MLLDQSLVDNLKDFMLLWQGLIACFWLLMLL
jgi:hypothetical protein